MIDLGLAGKRAVVSGAGLIAERAGHGRLTATRLAQAGMSVACIDIDEGRAIDTVNEILARDGRAFPVVADMTDPEQVERALNESVSRLGGIDVCVDIIGRATWDEAQMTSDADWEYSITNNLSQVFYLMRGVGSRMIEQGTGGSFVALTSVDGIAASAFHAPYGAAKAGVISLVKTFADELGRWGIRVNAVAPGNVGGGNHEQSEGEYDINGINPLAPPRAIDIANAALFLSSDLAARITGQTLRVDGGATIHSLWGINRDAISHFGQY